MVLTCWKNFPSICGGIFKSIRGGRLARRTKELNGSKEGMIHLTYIYTLGSTFVPKMVRRFLDAYPDYHIDFQFIVGKTGDIIEGLKNDQYDMVFSSYQDGEPDIDFRQIGDQKLVLAVPKDHPLAMYDSVDLKIRWIIHESIFRRKRTAPGCRSDV